MLIPTFNAGDRPPLLYGAAPGVALVTGANSGLGRQCALALAAAGTRVLLACRHVGRAHAALTEVERHASGPMPELIPLDLADLDSVRDAAVMVRARVSALDLLINNAGVMALPSGQTKQGHEIHFGTNHLGHFALTGLLMDTLCAAEQPRVVTVSSHSHWTGRMQFDDLDGHTRRHVPWLAYSQSKLANLLFMQELNRTARRAGHPLRSVGAHPGGSNTNLGTHAEGLVRAPLYRWASCLQQSQAAGAAPLLMAATSPVIQGGHYVGPQGWLGFRGAPGYARLSSRARDVTSARRLWAASVSMTGIEPQIPHDNHQEAAAHDSSS